MTLRKPSTPRNARCSSNRSPNLRRVSRRWRKRAAVCFREELGRHSKRAYRFDAEIRVLQVRNEAVRLSASLILHGIKDTQGFTKKLQVKVLRLRWRSASHPLVDATQNCSRWRTWTRWCFNMTMLWTVPHWTPSANSLSSAEVRFKTCFQLQRREDRLAESNSGVEF